MFVETLQQHLKLGSQSVLDWLLPPRCPMTGALVTQQGTLAPAYWSRLTFIHAPMCSCCGNPFPFQLEESVHAAIRCGACLREPPPFTTARAALKYDDASAKMVLQLKHGDGSQLVPVLANLLHQAGQQQLPQIDMIVPVPLHRGRLFRRRYNQAAWLGAALAKRAGKVFDPFCLQRIRATPFQGHKNRTARQENVRGAFWVSPQHHATLQGKSILLIDDVLTTGATVNECTRALLKAGAESVHVLCVARVVLTD